MTATRAGRKRKGLELTLSAEALDALRELAPAGRRSEYVEGLILDEWCERALDVEANTYHQRLSRARAEDRR